MILLALCVALVSLFYFNCLKIFDVKYFGAAGDGVSDDTAFIREAIRAAALERRSVVYFPEGVYLAAPTELGEAAFEIQKSGIGFRGEGPLKSVISLAASGGRDPAGAILRRGGAFLLRGTEANPLRGVTFQGLRITGNTLPNAHAGEWDGEAGRTGWDVTHKCIAIAGDVSRIRIDQCTLDGWRGEVIYAGGGSELGRFVITGSRIYNSNASAISMTGDVRIEGCEIFDVYNGVENFSIARHHQTVVKNCLIEPGRSFASAKFGVVFIGTRAASLTVRNSRIRLAHQAGIFLSEGAHNVVIRNNEIVDCPGIYAITLGLYDQFEQDRGYGNLRIEGNRFLSQGRSVQAPAIRFYGVALHDLQIKNNEVIQLGGATYEQFLDLPTAATRLRIERNQLATGVKQGH